MGHRPKRGERTLFFEPSDIRVKQYRSKAGALFCFGVDASGSMALHRMRQAKGAVHALLEKADVKRDRVALLAFRGQAAELLMPPTQSVELARRALDLLPTRGGTPLASGLLASAGSWIAYSTIGIEHNVPLPPALTGDREFWRQKRRGTAVTTWVVRHRGGHWY